MVTCDETYIKNREVVRKKYTEVILSEVHTLCLFGFDRTNERKDNMTTIRI